MGRSDMTETQFKTKAVRFLKRELPGAWIYHPTDRWVSGIPDLLILYGGWFFAIELKVGNNKSSKLQLVTLKRIGNAGGYCWTSWTMDDIRIICKKIKEAVNE